MSEPRYGELVTWSLGYLRPFRAALFVLTALSLAEVGLRAMKDAPILILDEPTSALDPVSERLILEAVERLRANRTTFVIAHRLSTVQDADRILLLDGGRIVAEGSHEALLDTSPLYREMARSFQTRGQPAPDPTRS